MNQTIEQTLASGDAVDTYIYSHPSYMRRAEPLTTIDFLDSGLEFRQIIYHHLLVPTSKTITFPSRTAAHSGKIVKPRLETSILYLNSQVYREATRVLYGENKFIAADPSDLFLPNGLQGLRRRTIKFIGHLSFEKKGGAADLCYETIESMYTPIWKMVVDYPGFLSLKKLTIRREVIRPVDLNIFALHMITVNQGKPLDMKQMYNKEMVLAAAAKLAWKAAFRGSIYEGLVFVEETKDEACSENEGYLSSAIEVCLARDVDAGADEAAESNLHSAVMDMLVHQKQGDLAASDQAYRRYMKQCDYV